MAEKRQKKTVEKSSRVDKLGCTWALSGKNMYNAFWTIGRTSGVRFLLDFSMCRYLLLAPNGPGIVPVFGRCRKKIVGYRRYRPYAGLMNVK